VLVDAARGLVPAYVSLKRTINSCLVRLSGIAKFAQFSIQCLQVTCSLQRPSGVDVVFCIQRLNLHLSATGIVSNAETVMSAGQNMKVRKPEPAEIEYKNMKFLITYRPTDATMDRFIEVGLIVCY